MSNSFLLPQFIFSQTSLQDYSDCPRRFQLRYIERLQWPAIETEPVLENERRQQEGQQFHRLVQQYMVGLPSEILAHMTLSPDLARWWKNFLSTDELHPPASLGYLHPEMTLAALVGRHRLLAKYDLITMKTGEPARIYEWKTWLKRPREEWLAARLQTRVYPALLVHAGASLNSGSPILPDQVEMVYWFSNYPSESIRFRYDVIRSERDWDFLTSLIDEISNHRHFPLTEDEKKCAFCPYRSYCNRGIHAEALEDMPETELVELDFNFEQIAEIEF